MNEYEVRVQLLIFMLFFSIFMLLFSGLLYALLTPFVPAGQASFIRWGMVLLNILSIAAVGAGFNPEFHGSWQGIVLQGATIWLMAQIFTAVALLPAAVIKLCYRLLTGSDMLLLTAGRGYGAVFLAAVFVIALGLSLYGSLAGRNDIHTVEYNVPVAGLGSRLEGYRIAQLSDVHLGAFYSLEDLQALLERTAAERPDVLVLTGDIFDNAPTTMQAARVLDSYSGRFPQGIYYCRGNHEHFRGIPLLETALADKNIHNMVNNHELVVEDTRPLYIAGVDYPMVREQFDFLQKAYTGQAMEGVPENAITVLLAHHPDFVTTAAGYGIELVLSGHTHGGQLGFEGIPLVPPVFKYMRGWYQEGSTRCYVHPGNGSWFPFRLGCQPEITIFTLTRE